MAKCRIYETLGSVKDMKVGQKDGLMTLSGVFGVCGVRNRNNRVYETKNYASRVAELKERIKTDGGVAGCLEHPVKINTSLEDISHKITDINIDENGVITGTIQLLNTPKGKIAQAIVEGGLPLYVSSRATGTIDKNGNVQLEKLITYDAVSEPGFLQAKMHLNESLEESVQPEDNVLIVLEKEGSDSQDIQKQDNNNQNIEESMEYKEILEKLTALENRVEELENENADLRESLENVSETQKLDPDQVKLLAEGIQNWIINEYSPEVQNWVAEEFAPEHKSEINEEMKQAFVDKVAPLIQKWIVEEYSPELQTWVVEQFAPEVQNWIINEFAPGIQNWVVEEYSPEVQNWLNESYMGQIKDEVKTIVTEAKKNSVSSIDETLRLLESLAPKAGEKPRPQGGQVTITEAHVDPSEPLYLQKMPDDKRVLWNQASQEIKESVGRRAKLYNFSQPGAFEKFWESIDLASIKPVNTVYEGLDSIYDEKERAIRAQLRRKTHVNYGLR